MVIRSSALLASTLSFASLCLCQTPAGQPSAPAPGPDSIVLQTGTKLVVLDVVVQDADGKPVHGLHASNFQLSESKKPQQIRNAEEHTPPPASAHAIDLGKMPPGVFTNYTPVPPGSTLNILLLDALNTPVLYQKWVRDQLRKYIEKAPPGQRIAIFGLTNQLILLQGFTSDPAVLKDVIDHKLPSRNSTLLADPTGTGADTNIDAAFNDALAGTPIAVNAALFENETNAVASQQRLQITLEAFNALAHYLSGFPGRKNLLWFSGSFPTGVISNAVSPNPVTQSSPQYSVNTNAIKQTTAALATAQVSIYPIDARGLMTDPTFDAANSGASLTEANSRAVITDIHTFNNSQADEHATMEDLAADTGGHAFYNTNGITQAVQEAIQSGSNYYTLTYNPTDSNWNGSFRSIQLKLVDAPSGIKLSYRPGYYAIPPRPLEKIDPEAVAPGTIARKSGSELAYDHAAMTRGAPTPEDIIFKVRVLPFATAPEAKLAPDNTLDPDSPAKGPFHRFAVDYALQPSEITLVPEPNGTHAGQVKFTVYVYDPNGKLLVAAHRGFNLTLKPDLYAKFIKAVLQCHMEVSVPDKTEAYLRIAVQDMPSDKFGVVEVPAAAVSKLTPLPAKPAAPAN
jgi:VWFA-related protein